MSRRSAYKQVLSIGAAAVLGFTMLAGSIQGAPRELSQQSNEQAEAVAQKSKQKIEDDSDEQELVVQLESGNTSSDSATDQGSGESDSSASSDSTTTGSSVSGVVNEDTERARGMYLTSIPEYTGNPYVTLRADSAHKMGTPSFTLSEYERAVEEGAFKKFSRLDSLGRTRKALACIGPESLGQGKRGDISRIHPSGWRQARYDFVPGESLYNRCHLIAWSLCGENANRKNLITGTRYLNETGMLPFEEQILNYVRETGNHVLYRVTPMYKDDELVCRGVRMEAQSVEDHGESLCFHVYCYNLQPHVTIDYATGKNQAAGE